MLQGPILLVILVLAIVFIIWSTGRSIMHPFLALLVAAYGIGLSVHMPPQDIAKVIAEGFGGLMTNIGIVIVAGTIIGVFLEKSGAALKMAETVLKVVGPKRPTVAMSIIGYIVSIPVFCDSGFVILSSLKRALARSSKISIAALAIALSTGLYATHVMVPPTPGPLAAAGNLSVTNLGLVILIGMVVAIPTAVAGYLWARRFSSLPVEVPGDDGLSYEEMRSQYGQLPSAAMSFTPIAIPIILIALSSIANFPSKPFGSGAFKTILNFIGTPTTALLVGVALCFLLVPKTDKKVLNDWVAKALKDAAVILIITGAGGSLGKMLGTTPITKYLGTALAQYNLGIFLPFIIAAALKTAQGSSTVALVTTSAIMAPLLPAMGFTTEVARVLVVMAIGAGSMVVSHANDSYFWVVSQFSGLDVPTAYRTQTIATLIQGLVAIITVAVLTAIVL
ncbi:MAG: GntP family permease [Peptococcaceae bacterium]|nr:GntP family permease [Peptococcaceae bacterium]